MRKALIILSIMAVASLFNTEVFASVNDDQVTSQKIKEADGTSGQNTNSGSGIKTGHIQDGAITTDKIANGVVTTIKILDSAVTSTKIADGAVTDAKISGSISGSKISSVGLNADTVDGQHASAFATASHTQAMSTVVGLEAALAGKSDVTHNHDTLYQQKYGKVAVVAQTGGDYTDPVAAMNDIATWCKTPSAMNPCLVKIMPGVYDLSNSVLQVGPYVDVEGSGEGTTILSSSTLPVVVATSYLPVVAGAFAEIRNLKIESTAIGEGNNATFDCTQYGSGVGFIAKLHHVTIFSSNIIVILNRGWGICEINDSTIISSDPIEGGARMFTMFSGTATLKNVTAKGGTFILGSYDLTIINSKFDGNVSVPGYGSLKIFNSQVTSVNSGGPTTKCVNVIDANFDAYNCTRL